MARRLERLLPAPAAEKLSACGVVDCERFYELSDIELMNICDVSYQGARSLIAELSAKLSGKRVCSALDLLRQRETGHFYVPTGLPGLDEALGGGLAAGTLAEVCGAPGVGKSQLCLSCCASALLLAPAGSGPAVIYLDTELKFSPERLKEILSARRASVNTNALLDSIIVKRISTVKDLYSDIENLESEVIAHGVSLVVIDSIAALARREGLNEVDKDTFILKQGALLKRLAEQCHCVVLTTNQVALRDTQEISTPGAGEEFSSVLVSSIGASSESAPGCIALANRLRPTLGMEETPPWTTL